MKKIFLILPILAFVIVLLNGLFGHSLFTTPYDQDINKYSIYVHFQEEWNSFPSNVLFEVTNVWSNSNPNHQIYPLIFLMFLILIIITLTIYNIKIIVVM